MWCVHLQITGETVGEVKAVADMHQRKAEMAKHSDAFIALPGLFSLSFPRFLAISTDPTCRIILSMLLFCSNTRVSKRNLLCICLGAESREGQEFELYGF